MKHFNLMLASATAVLALGFAATSASAQSTNTAPTSGTCYSHTCGNPTPTPAPQAQRRVLQFEAMGATFGEAAATASAAGDETSDETYAIKEGGIDFRADIAGQGCETDCASLSYSGTLFETMRSGGLSSAMSTNGRPATSHIGNSQIAGLAARVVVDSAIGQVPTQPMPMPEHQPQGE